MSFSPQAKAMDLLFRENFTNATSVSRNGFTIVGSPSISSGVYSNDGTNTNYLSCDVASMCRGSRIRTISLWYRGTEDTAQATIGFRDGTDFWTIFIGMFVGTLPTGLFGVSADYPGASQARLAYQTATRTEMFDGAWHHIAVTMDGTANSTKLYLDGDEKTVTLAGGTVDLGYVPDLSTTATIGINAPLTGSSIDGNIKDLKISSREWNAQEVLDDCQGTTFSYMQRRLIVAPLHDKTGTSPYYTTDLSVNARTLTLTGSPTQLTHRNGYSSDGTGRRIIGTDPTQGKTALSFAMWVDVQRSSFNGTYKTILDTSNTGVSTGDGWYVNLDDRGGGYGVNTYWLYVATQAGTYRAAGTQDNEVKNGVQFFAGTYEASTFALYVDGRPTTLRYVGAGTGNMTPGVNDKFSILSLGNGTNGINGSILNVVGVWDYVLTPTQMMDTYLKGSYYRGNL